MIDFEQGLTAPQSLKDYAGKVQKLRDRLEEMTSQLGKQGNVLHNIDGEIAALLDDKALAGSDPRAMVEVKRKITSLREKRADEQDLYDAIADARENLKAEVSEAIASLHNSCRGLVGTAARKVADEVKQNLRQAMEDYCAAHYAKLNGRTMLGAQYEMERLTFDSTIEKGAMDRIHRTYEEIQAEVQV